MDSNHRFRDPEWRFHFGEWGLANTSVERLATGGFRATFSLGSAARLQLTFAVAAPPKHLGRGSIGQLHLPGRRGLTAPDRSSAAAPQTAPRTIVDVSPEQILAWQPDVILTVDRRFRATIRADPVWREVKAVQTGNVHFVPDLPFSWLDNPPAPNRLIGLLWLGKLLYPASFPQDIRAEARRFYALFYQQEPSDAQLDSLLAESPG